MNPLCLKTRRRSIALEPGKKIPIVPAGDVRITNAALSDNLVDENSRTTVKFTYKTPGAPDDEDFEDEEEESAIQPTTTTVLCSLTPGKVCASLLHCSMC